MKKTLLLLTLAAFGLAPTLQAQDMRAVNAALSRHNLHDLQMRQMQQMTYLSMSRSSGALYNPKAVYMVLLQDSTVKEVKSKMLFDERKRSYLELEDKTLKKTDPRRVQRIYPTDTRSIYKIDMNGNPSPLGQPADSCWLFKVVHGKVNGYSFLPATANLHSGYLKFVQKGDGALEKVDKEVIKSMLSDNHKAVMLVYDDKFYDALVEYNKVKPAKK
ncbi:hypothetical protein [Rufibacter psychrotolerans]|uniref:hypothetical protein n=1 Tax=Rufibacter psychrotolerans TaxID=2812556 RepID=UPI001967736A|nr:hypothetical protein [Rufibacter sp. SYSU D00308]